MFMKVRFVCAVTTVVVLAGCGEGRQTQDEKDRQAEEYAKSFGVDAKVTTSADGTKSVAIDRSMGGMAMQGGSNLRLPAGFPDDVPMYPELNIVSSAQLPGGFTIQGQTNDSLDQVAEFYVGRMASSGWSHEPPAQQPPTMRMLPFSKDNRTTSVSLIAGQGTTVQVVSMAKP